MQTKLCFRERTRNGPNRTAGSKSRELFKTTEGTANQQSCLGRVTQIWGGGGVGWVGRASKYQWW